MALPHKYSPNCPCPDCVLYRPVAQAKARAARLEQEAEQRRLTEWQQKREQEIFREISKAKAEAEAEAEKVLAELKAQYPGMSSKEIVLAEIRKLRESRPV